MEHLVQVDLKDRKAALVLQDRKENREQLDLVAQLVQKARRENVV